MAGIRALQSQPVGQRDTAKPLSPTARPGRRAARHLALGLCALAAAGCASHTVRVVDMTPPAQLPTADESLLLDVGVAVLDANVVADYEEQVKQNVTAEVRRAEANFIAYFAKNLLQSTGNWGAVRVVPRATNAVDVTVAGTILHSDGERMALAVEVRDARGEVWLSHTYEALASKYAYEDTVPADIDPFQTVYRQLADDMLAYRQTLSDEDIRTIRATAEMRFARDFVPDAFGPYVAEQPADEDGEPAQFSLRRLPAEGDQMLARVRKVREREYLFIDTLDEHFGEFHDRMYPSYQNWRRATYKEAIAFQQERRKARAKAMAGVAGLAVGLAAQTSDTRLVRYGGAVSIIGGALAISRAVQDYADAEIHSEVLHELGISAEAEIAPHTIELENRSIALEGSVAAQYDQLRTLLKQIYYREMGLALPPPESAGENAAAALLDAEAVLDPGSPATPNGPLGPPEDASTDGHGQS